MDGRRILIFLETKKGCDAVTRQLRMDGWPALSIHGDKSQHERDWVLAEFKAGKHPIMIATDVAARGLGRSAPPQGPSPRAALAVVCPPPAPAALCVLERVRCWPSLAVARGQLPACVCECACAVSSAACYRARCPALPGCVALLGRLRVAAMASGACCAPGAAGGGSGRGNAATRPGWERFHGSTMHGRPPRGAAAASPAAARRGSAAAPVAWCAGHLRACTATHPVPFVWGDGKKEPHVAPRSWPAASHSLGAAAAGRCAGKCWPPIHPPCMPPSSLSACPR